MQILAEILSVLVVGCLGVWWWISSLTPMAGGHPERALLKTLVRANVLVVYNRYLVHCCESHSWGNMSAALRLMTVLYAHCSTSEMWMHFPPWSVYVNITDPTMQSNKTVCKHTLDNACLNRINTVDHLKMVLIHINWLCSVAAIFVLVSYLAYFRPWRWRRHVPPKRRLIFSRPHDVVCWKI
jgi:hypothetical protein